MMVKLTILRQELVDVEKNVVEFDFSIGNSLFRCWRARPSKHGGSFWVTPPSRLNRETGAYTDYVEFSGDLKDLVNATLGAAAIRVVENPQLPPQERDDDIPF